MTGGARTGEDSEGSHGGAGRHAGHSVEMFRRLFFGALLLTVPILVWSPQIQEWLGFSAPTFPGSDWIPTLLGTALFGYGGRVFLIGGVRELRRRTPGMMTLISLAIAVAFTFSAAVALGARGMPLWWELATLITVMLLGHWIEMRSVTQARGALRELAKLLPSTAERVDGEQVKEVPIRSLAAEDIVLLRPGARVPADGVVVSGTSELDESMLTGESRPVKKVENDRVIAGTVNGSGSLRVRVTGTGEQTALAGIMRLVEQAQTSRSRAQALADRAALWLTVIAVASSAITLIAWLALGASPQYAIERVVTVLVIACPHALGLAIPLVIAISTTLAARNGLLVRDRRGLEEARRLDTVVFDKTGTLTLGEFRVLDIATTGTLGDGEALALAAAAERDSEHTIARAMVRTAEERGIEVPAADDFQALPGRGVRARVSGRELQVGGPALIEQLEATVAPELRQHAEQATLRGQTVVYLVAGSSALAAFAVADAIRAESRDAVRWLHDAGIEVAMLTGDAATVAAVVGAELDIDVVMAGVLPEQKARRIEEMQARGRRVGMVGDGVNDAPALLTADVGIAIGAGTDVAVEAGDVVLVRDDPRDVPRIIRLSRATYRKMVQNLWWAAGYNIVAIPLAAGVLEPIGIVLHPAIGAMLMSMSTVIVALNAQLLRRETLQVGDASADAAATRRATRRSLPPGSSARHPM